jgi:lantibiotic transport system ATP-binding protein
MTNCIETKGLSYHFSKNDQVLRDIHLMVPEGSIFGFLGPNGAGKTTTLKLLLGLLKNQSGEILFFGKPFQENRIDILKNVGSLIESPSIYPHLTATENLRIWQKVYQCPMSKIQEVLEIVDLTKTGKKRAGKFSLGMKQRLSIAIALLHDPKILVLDEPTNGLDPSGILEIRNLLTKINQEKGTTIVISSHLLSEIEKLVTHVGIINKGEILFQGTLPALQDLQNQQASIVFRTDNLEAASEIFKEKGIVSSIENNKITLPVLTKEKVADLNKELVTRGISVYEISQQKNDLESIFMDLTK